MIDKIANFNIDDIQIGYKHQFKLIVSESMLYEFSKLSGDQNPLHVDEKYAQNTKFKKRVIPGMLLASFLSRLVGMHLPGENALYLAQTLRFIHPCFINDEIMVEGEVTSKSKATGIITLETKITNSFGNQLVEGQAKVLVRS